MQIYVAKLDKPIHKSRASKSVDRRFFYTIQERRATDYKASKIVQGLVGIFQRISRHETSKTSNCPVRFQNGRNNLEPCGI